MELFDLERKIKNNIEVSKIKQNLLEGFLNELQKIGDGKIKNNIEGSKIKQNLLEGFLNELQKIGDGKGKNSFGDRENMLESEFRKEGEIYEVDEIGDDEKYVFLTRLSDKAQMQEFDISNKLYNELLNCKNEELKVVFHNGDYKIIT